MTKDEIFAEILEAVSAADGRVDLSLLRLDETPFRVHGLTSLTQLRVCVDVSDRLGVPFSDNDVLLASTPLRLASLIERRLAEAA
jgi:acyl carrier protein